MGQATQRPEYGPEAQLDQTDISAYLEHLKSERSYSSQTLKAYADDLRGLMLALEQMRLGPGQLQEADIRRLVAATAKAKISPKTQARRLSCWRGYFDWLARLGKVQTNPVRAVKAPRASQVACSGSSHEPGRPCT
jgi:integrase/recombinase XerC